MKRFIFPIALIALWAAVFSPRAQAATLLSHEKAAEIVALRNVEIKDGEVSGELVNRSGRLLRDVELLIRYTWLWQNEFKPGKDDPGTAVYYTVQGSIPAGQSLRFTYKPPSPLPARPDGTYATSIAVVGFSELYYQ